MTNWMLMTAFFIGISMSVISCKDDDNDSNSTQKQEQEAQEEASKFWSVVGQLVSVDDVTDEYEGKTFEPTIGMPDETKPLARIVSTNDMQTAAQRFADLIDASDIDENTTNYIWTDPEIGTMTYTKGGIEENWATVDADIKAVPHLKQIIYKVGGEGDNSTFDGGRAYYRFGDVISRELDVVYSEDNNDRRGTITEYWICVRPSFDPESKGDSHWVCVNTVSDKNYKYWAGSNKTDYWVPYSLTTNKENMQNFAELLYAICFPGTWYENVNNYHTDGSLYGFSGLPIFADFKKKYIQFHNQYFWQNVQNAWVKNKVAEKALNLPGLSTLIDIIRNDGVRLLYKGYHWLFRTSWNCELYEAIYTNGTKTKEYNLHHLETKTHKQNMKDIEFDVREMGKKFENYEKFFGKDGKYRWAIRYATGKELAKNGRYDPQQQINGVTDVYRYYRDVVRTNDLWLEPEITKEPSQRMDVPVVGCVYTKAGHFYPDRRTAVQEDEEPIALVVYLGGDKRVEYDYPYNGLAVALKDAGEAFFSTEESKMKLCAHEAHDLSQVSTIFFGHTDTSHMGFNAQEHGHMAADMALSHVADYPVGSSGWFLPSTGQWCLAMEGMGYGKFISTNQVVNGETQYKFEKNGKWWWNVAGLESSELQTNALYLTSTEQSDESREKATGKVWGFYYNGERSTFVPQDKTEHVRIRSFIAFEYGKKNSDPDDDESFYDD